VDCSSRYNYFHPAPPPLQPPLPPTITTMQQQQQQQHQQQRRHHRSQQDSPQENAIDSAMPSAASPFGKVDRPIAARWDACPTPSTSPPDSPKFSCWMPNNNNNNDDDNNNKYTAPQQYPTANSATPTPPSSSARSTDSPTRTVTKKSPRCSPYRTAARWRDCRCGSST